MTKNPIYNALFAISYIVVLVTTVFNASNYLEGVVEETIFLPMAFLAIFVLSAALMAYLFFYQPVVWFLDGHREEGVTLFLKTMGAFAVATALVVVVALVAGMMGIETLK